MKKVFLGGTCNESEWRTDMKELLEAEGLAFFDPVVTDWGIEAQAEEFKQRAECDFCLYVITPKMAGVYSVAEVIDDSHKRPLKTVFVVIKEEDGDLFTKGQLRSLDMVGDMVRRNGGAYMASLALAAKWMAIS